MPAFPNLKFHVARLLGAALLCAATQASIAQSPYPARPIRMIVTVAAGGGVDLMARITAQRLSEQLGKQVLVENQGGSGGTLARGAVARAPADGYTLLFDSLSNVTSAVLMTNLKYDPVSDLVPVTLATQFPLVIIVSPDTPAKTLKEFLALARDNPGKYSYASSGIGSIPHLALELFKSLARVDILHVPYKGNAPAVADLFAGRVTMMIDGVPPQLKNITSGKVRALGVSTKTRSFVLPNVPTVSEDGLPDYEVAFWTGIFAPAKTPKAIIDALAAETAAAMKHPEIAARLKELGADGVGSSPEEFERQWRKELASYGKIARDAGIKAQE